MFGYRLTTGVFGSSGRHANPIGLSYPLLTWLDILSGPLRPGFLD